MPKKQKPKRLTYDFRMPWGRWLVFARANIYGPIVRVYFSDDGTPFGRARYLFWRKGYRQRGCIAVLSDRLCGGPTVDRHYCARHRNRGPG